MKFECTGVILAGGNNSRLPGKKKGFHRVGRLSILEKTYNLLSELFQEVIIAVNDPRNFLELNMMVVRDIIPSKCALAGIHAGLFYASYPWSYITACDFPFANRLVIEYLIKQITSGFQVIIPRTPQGLEPLTALYSKTCIDSIEKNLANNIFMIKKFFNKKKVKEIPFDQLQKLDPNLRFKFNVNTPEDLEKAKLLASEMEL